MFVVLLRKRQILYALTSLIILIVLFSFIQHLFQSREAPVVNPIYIGNTKEKAISLMVNVDWGEDVLPDMLKTFQENNIKATFFITGRFANKFPDTVKMIAAAGHEIGNHGYSHPHPDKISIEENIKEITDTENQFLALNLNFCKVYAPPYGEHKKHVLDAAESQGYKTILWTIDTIDWKEPSPDQIIKRVINKADNGALVLMHPKKCTLEALPQLITDLTGENFIFKTVSEIIQ